MSGSFGGMFPLTSDQYQQAYDNQFDNYESQQTSCAIGEAAQNFMAACGRVTGANQDVVAFAQDISEIIQAATSGGAGATSLVLTLAGKATPVGGALIAALGAVAGGVQVGEDKSIQPQLGSTLDEIAEGLALVGLVAALIPLEAPLGALAAAVGIAAGEAGVAGILLSLVSLVQSAASAATDLKQGGQLRRRKNGKKSGGGSYFLANFSQNFERRKDIDRGLYYAL